MCINIRNLFKICFPSLSLVIKFWDGRPPSPNLHNIENKNNYAPF